MKTSTDPIKQTLVQQLDSMAKGWLCEGLPDAELPRKAAREIEKLRGAQLVDMIETLRLRTRVEALRGLCKTAVGMLRDADRTKDAETIHALIGDMESPIYSNESNGQLADPAGK
jgi:O-succinylbenzoate synthase